MSKNNIKDNQPEVITPNLSSEEKFVMWWNDNKGKILSISILTIVLILGYQVVGILKTQKLNSMQTAYQEASSDFAALLTFAQSNRGSNLAGLAWIELADQAYKEKDYSKSSELYENAAQDLRERSLLSRAKLGQAISLQQDGKSDQSIATFQSIISDDSYTANIRSQAAYKLILIAVENKNRSLAEDTLTQLKALPDNTIWLSQAENLLDRLS